MKPIIRVRDLSKQYAIGARAEPYSTLRESLVRAVRKPMNLLRKDSSDEKSTFWALKDINFDVMPGEVVGIIGRNGAGKSTLLKILSRITEPTNGKIELYGRVGSLLEVGTGFHAELTGRENIYLNGAILGMRREEIAKKFDEIVDFAEVEGFLDTPVKRYSSGMYMRLAFAVAAHLEPEILVVDEVLAVGDAQFQKKCLGKMKDVAEHGRTVIFVSHNMGAIRELCSSGILLAGGHLISSGAIDVCVAEYLQDMNSASAAYTKSDAGERSEGVEPVEFNCISLHNEEGREAYNFEVDESITVCFDVEIRELPRDCSIFFMILNRDRVPVCVFESDGVRPNMSLRINRHFLTRGRYSIHTFFHTPRVKAYDVIHDQVCFEVTDTTSQFARYGGFDYGSVFGAGEWF